MNYNRKLRKSQDDSQNFESVLRIDGKKCFISSETGEIMEILEDISPTGKERDWALHKMENLSVERIYRQISDCYLNVPDETKAQKWTNLADRLNGCASRLLFNVYADKQSPNGERKKIKGMTSCRIRLCPMCSWRRSMKIHSQCRKIIEAMESEQKYDYLLLTLTVPNVSANQLNSKVDELMEAFHRFVGYKRFEKSVLGWYRSLEITHNVNRKSKSFNTYHPHFHCILAVKKNYFHVNNNTYIHQSEWLSMWQKAMNDYSITQVDVRKVKSGNDKNVISAICEIAKYTVKTGDYVIPSDWVMSCNTVMTLSEVLAYRRLVAFGGIMKEWHKKLNLDDPIDGDLTADGEDVNVEFLRTECYIWNFGYQQYIKRG